MRILIVVHPGSACGSADFNLGRSEARAARESLVSEIAAWSGPALIVDGTLSDELDDYPVLGAQIEALVGRSRHAGHPARRVFACDDETDNWPAVVSAALDEMGLPMDLEAVVTGAWHFEDHSAGCVNAVQSVVCARGGSAELGWGVLSDPDGALSLNADPGEDIRPLPRV